MENIDWNEAPDWAERLMSNIITSEKCWADSVKYQYVDSEGSNEFERSDFSFALIEYRPDTWQEGEERMNVIPQNGNDGEHYAEVDDSIMTVDGYECLKDVLVRAYDQASKGKGDERHARGDSFDQQPMQNLIDLYGVGFALGQSAKKSQESMRLPKDRAIAELLGGIVYLAGAIISMEKNK
jgi:hypothetical protein